MKPTLWQTKNRGNLSNPSRVLKNRFEDEIKDLLIELRWWDLPLADIKQIKRELCANPTKEILLKLIKNYRQ